VCVYRVAKRLDLTSTEVKSQIKENLNISEDESPSTFLDTFLVEIHHFLHSQIYDLWCVTKCQYVQYSLQAATLPVLLVTGLPSTNLFWSACPLWMSLVVVVKTLDLRNVHSIICPTY
jgi:hypothetical protein